MSTDPLVQRFCELARERTALMNNFLLTLERDPGKSETKEALDRELHTLKGDAAMLDLRETVALAHRLEDILRAAGGLDETAINRLFEGFDLIACLAESGGRPGRAADREALASFLGESVAAPGAERTDLESDPPGPALAAADEPEPESAERDDDARSRAREEVRVRLHDLAELNHLVGHLSLDHARQEAFKRDLAHVLDELARTVDRIRLRAPGDDPERARALVREAQVTTRAISQSLVESLGRFRELEDRVFELRLTSVGAMFERCARVLRDASRGAGRRARLELRGHGVRADKRVLEVVDDVLLHLIRNAVTHGLESAEERRRLGKPEEGVLELSARTDKGEVEFRLADDGMGVQLEAVRERVRHRRGLDDEAARRLTDEQLLDSLFESGLSTRTDADQLAGRGVGLDVVRERIHELGGRIHVQSEPGRGTVFVWRVPVSLAVVDILVFSSGAAMHGLPIAAVETLTARDPGSRSRSGAGVEYQGEMIPLRRLDAEGRAPSDAAEGAPLLILREGGRCAALAVESVLGHRRVVRRRLNALIAGQSLVTGTALLESGELVTLLSPGRILRGELQIGNLGRAEDRADRSRLSIVIAEDSDLTRDMVSATLRRMGHRVREAVNGREALEAVEREAPDLLLTDLDMPVMDGFQLIRRLRERDATATLPVAVLTTRSDASSRRKAEEAGADLVLAKSRFREEALAEALASLTRSDEGGDHEGAE